MASRQRNIVRETALILALYPVVIFGLAYRPFGELLAATAVVSLVIWATFMVGRRRRRHPPGRVAGPPPPPTSMPVLTPHRGRPGPGSGSPVPSAAAVPQPQPPVNVDAVARKVFRRVRSKEVARAASDGES